ncbi:MAG: bifunctional dihydropteridine reductase/dihydrofolate reductase TmpR [Trueperaceae bacterium]|nr:bifunctional dihydropteridine reductase/dihydrofolate reductase TmpR [Trueperaceae bacterium]
MTVRPAALVTGSAKGIGKAILLALAEHGYDVAVHYRSSQQEAHDVAKEAEKLGVKAITLQADVSVAEEARMLVEKAHEQFGRLDVLVNNVGNYHKAALAEVSPKDWHEMFDSNLHAVFYTCQTAVPYMQKQGKGRIINIGFAGAEQLIARPVITAYGIAKTGVILYSKALAKSEAASGITVNVVSPGVMENSESKPVKDIPLGRTGNLAELTSAVSFLVSDEASYITGITLEVAGGWNL